MAMTLFSHGFASVLPGLLPCFGDFLTWKTPPLGSLGSQADAGPTPNDHVAHLFMAVYGGAVRRKETASRPSLKNMKVSWDYYSQYIYIYGKIKFMLQTTNQFIFDTTSLV